MNRTERHETAEIERVLDTAYDSSFAQETGRIALDAPIHHVSPKRALLEDFGWDSMGTYLEAE